MTIARPGRVGDGDRESADWERFSLTDKGRERSSAEVVFQGGEQILEICPAALSSFLLWVGDRAVWI